MRKNVSSKLASIHSSLLQRLYKTVQIIFRFVLFFVPQLAEIFHDVLKRNLARLVTLLCSRFLFVSFLDDCEQVQQLSRVHGQQTRVVLGDHCVGNVQFELLKSTTLAQENRLVFQVLSSHCKAVLLLVQIKKTV